MQFIFVSLVIYFGYIQRGRGKGMQFPASAQDLVSTMSECHKCHAALEGEWNLPHNSPDGNEKNGRYLGITNGYFLYDWPNWVNCYCHTCWKAQLLELAPTIFQQPNLLQDIAAQQQQKNTLTQEVAALRLQKTTLSLEVAVQQQQKTSLEKQVAPTFISFSHFRLILTYFLRMQHCNKK